MDADALSLARLIWDYLRLHQQPLPAGAIVALGTNDLRVAEFAADLYHRRFGSVIVCTGGLAHQSDLLATSWDRTEAEMYAEVVERRGVPRSSILLEPRATNTGENVRFTRNLLQNWQEPPHSIIYAVKPFMQRRTMATHAVYWPEMPATVASPNLTLDEYFTDDLQPERVVNIMLGDLQRIWIYDKLGWQAPQVVPDKIREAFGALSAMGFTKHLIAEQQPAAV